jgi:hypothetical protein
VARLLLNTLLLAGLCAGVLAARVVLHGETFNERTGMLIALGALSGGVAGAILTPLFRGRTSGLWRWRAAAAFIWVFMLAMTIFYVVEVEVFAYRHDPPAMMRPLGILMGMAHTAGYFLAFSPAYLLPWQLPLLALLAAALLPGIKPSKG